jgi:hypothetical protein
MQKPAQIAFLLALRTMVKHIKQKDKVFILMFSISKLTAVRNQRSKYVTITAV